MVESIMPWIIVAQWRGDRAVMFRTGGSDGGHEV